MFEGVMGGVSQRKSSVGSNLPLSGKRVKSSFLGNWMY